ncbi:hypothetical protein BsWGS_05969 [Bradybaena similaris]
MDQSNGRRKWSSAEPNIQVPLNVPAAKEEVPPQYEHYLHLLQERNRLIRRLRQKDKKEIELEKKEKGFTLYLNSSFSSDQNTKANRDRRHHKYRSKTADHLQGSNLQLGDHPASRSANIGREKRKNWCIGSVEFTTADGQRLKIKPPERLTGKYADDFESSTDSDCDQSDLVYSMSSLNVGDDQSISNTNSRRHKTNYLKKVVAAKREEAEAENRVTFKLEDVKKLRESLQMNTTIRQSLAMEADSDESDGGRVSPLFEEIEEEISSEDDNRGRDDHTVKPLKDFKPGNTLVLEFQSLPANNASKASRPLSANLRNSDSRADPKEEASAVIRALQEENKKVELFSKASSSRPLPEPKSTAAFPRPLPSPAKETTKLQPPRKSSSNPDQAKPDNTTVDSKLQSAGDEYSNINVVIEKVLKMNPRQQKQLLQTLNHIDVDEKSIDLSKASCQLNSVASSWASRSPVTDHFEVTLEIVSNWGHSSLVGLTELEFFDQLGCLIPIKSSDVSVQGARGSTNKVEVLFNGKSKTTRERNMWSCLFDGRPVEFSILMVNPHPGKQFQLGSVKVWNWNHKISNLDIGAREIKIVFGGELLFHGDVDKGCGNQVFDYSKHIMFTHVDKTNSSHAKKPPTKSGLSLNLGNAAEPGTVSPSPRGCSKPLPNLMSPTETQKSPAMEDNQKLASSRSHHSFRSISRSSQSSASSSGSAKMKVHSDGRVEELQADGPFRSETRTLNYPTVLAAQSSSRSVPTSPEVSMTDSDLSRLPEKKRAQTPKKTNSIAARLSGKSVESDCSLKSNTDSYESKPPLPPTDKSNEKINTSSRSVDRSSNMTKSKLSPKSSRSDPHMSPRPTSTSSNTNLANSSLIKSQDAKNKNEQDQSLVDKIKTMGQSENKRKKDIPRWLKGDETPDLLEHESGKKSTSGLSKKTGGKVADETLQKQLDEELERFSQVGNGSKDNPSKSFQEENDILVPLKRTEKARAKWRTRDESLEESWGSLSFFNKSHRGRVSVDIADDELDEYLSVSRKTVPEVSDIAPKLSLSNDDWLDDDSDFIIPELPYGRELVINIKTTWGDHHYVGLTGLELFSNLGEKVPIAKIWANPSDINILPEYNKDPRVVTNIVDQVNRTRDDVHMWLAPFNPGKDHFIYVSFAKPCKLALMRIWNYNKSRIHSYRGAKDVVITLDGTEIFKGEIARACGGIEGGTEAFGDTILFTTDENILEMVSKNDSAFECDMPGDDEEDVPFERPSTANAEDETRPFTRAAGLLEAEKKKSSPQMANLNFVTSVGDVLVYKANKLQLIFTATWGDLHYLGLTGLEIVGSEGEIVPLTQSMVTASPKDLRHLPGNEKDDRTLDKLLDGVNITCLDSHMWLIPFTNGGNHTVTITFPQQTLITAVRIWNYNKSPEDTYRGAKVMHVHVNDRVISPLEGYLLRKGPGVCHFDFAQEISFSNNCQAQGHGALSDGSVSSREQHLESSVQMPRGFIFQLQLFCTWGDQYYIGLNGLEFYDALFNKLELTETNIAAYPDSVNVLDNVSNDVRTPDKLIDGFNDTNDGRHTWLAPILPSVTNRVYVIFDQPTSVSMIKLWNYSKTVSRGVKDFALLVDDLLVYNGTLQAVTGGAVGIIPSCSAPIPHHTILFSDNKEIILKEKNSIISNQAEDQDIQLLNDKQIVSKYAKSSSSKPVNQALRPKTSVTTTRIVKR